MQALSISTTNFQTFAELAFSFTLTPQIVLDVARVRAGDGLRRRIPAGGARGADDDRRRAAGGVTGGVRSVLALRFGTTSTLSIRRVVPSPAAPSTISRFGWS